MNINDYKDGNGNVEVSETLVSDIIGGINGVVESGSESNGYWYKFESGLLVCTHTMAITGSFTAEGSLFAIPSSTWNFPSTFIAIPFAYTSIANYNNIFQATGSSGTLTTSHSFRFMRTASSGSVTLNVVCVAIGRWK